MTGFAAGMGQAGAGIGTAIGLALTNSPKNPLGSQKRVSKYIDNTFVPITGGGLRYKFNKLGSGNYGFEIAPSQERLDTVNALSSVYGNSANNVGGLLADVKPGYGRLTDAVVQSLGSARQRGLSDLQGELNRRRLLGSSFGMDTLARAEREYGQAENQARAQAFIAELDASSKLIDQQTTYAANEYITKLNELNMEAGIAFNLSSMMQQSLNSAAAGMMGMAYEEQQARNAAWIGASANFVGGSFATAGAGVDTGASLAGSFLGGPGGGAAM